MERMKQLKRAHLREEEKKKVLEQIEKMISENLTLELEHQEEDEAQDVKLIRERGERQMHQGFGGRNLRLQEKQKAVSTET